MTDSASQPQLMFFSFGMFIIDEITHLSPSNTTTTTTTLKPQPTYFNLPGGAGLYALLGARLLSPSPHSHQLSWILDAGSDLPPHIPHQIQSWRTSTIIRYDAARLTTRAWNWYGPGEHRAFRYLTPKRRLDVEDLSDEMVRGMGWHLVCSPGRAMEVLGKLERRRGELGVDAMGRKRKAVVWEPIPDMCLPSELERLRAAIQCVDVISPNDEELRSFFYDESENDSEREQETQNESFGQDGLGKQRALSQDELVARLMGWSVPSTSTPASTSTSDVPSRLEPAHNTACIVREGKHGSTIYFPPTTTNPPTGQTVTSLSPSTKSPTTSNRKIHLPAYHTPTLSHRVKDPTGGGNTHLGALTLALAYSHSRPPLTSTIPPALARIQAYFHAHLPCEALSQTQLDLLVGGVAACVAAGFAIEQVGVPELRYGDGVRDGDGGGGEGKEWWGDHGYGNDTGSVIGRVDEYLAQEGRAILDQIQMIVGR